MSTDVRVAVLLYHHVGPVRHEKCRGLTVSPEAFASHIGTLAAMGHNTILPSDWVGYVQGKWELPRRPVMITFDDGYADLVEFAFPVLSRHGFSATVFVPTALLGESIQCNPNVRDARMEIMSAAQIAEAAANGIDFGAHSRSHADLEKLEPSEVIDEIRGSRDDLASILGREITAFAYPFGNATPTAVKLASDIFPAAFTIEQGVNDKSTPLHLLRRTMVQHRDTVADVCLRARFGGSVLDRIRKVAHGAIGPRAPSLGA